MTDEELLRLVEEGREARELSQANIALACNISQGHLSKILKGKVKLGRRARVALAAWLHSEEAIQTVGGSDQMTDLVRRLSTKSEKMHNLIMHILKLLDEMTG
jgi:transcriptional regulator with XRE-family HTH domain